MRTRTVLFLASLAVQAAAAATYDVSWTRSSSGTMLSQPVGPYAMSATAGQSEAGGVEGCAVSLQGGFWVAAAAANPPPVEGDTADLALGIKESADPVRVGAEVTFSICVTNLGPAAATRVVLTNTLPTGLEVVSVASLRPFSIEGDRLVADLGTIGVSACAEIQVVLRAGPTGLYTVSAEVRGEQTDPNLVDNMATEATTVFDGEVRSFTWTGAGSSSLGWDDPRNWAPSIPNPPWTSTNGPPGLADTAILPAGRGDVWLGRDVTVGSLILETTLVTSNTLTVAREGAWRRGRLSGFNGFATLAIAPGARFDLEGTERKALSVARVVNAGHLVWSGTGVFDNTDRGGEVDNLRGATFEIRTGATLGWSGYSRLNNEGRMIKEGGDQVMDLPLVNDGLLELRSGTSEIRGAFTNRSRLVIGPGATLKLVSRSLVTGQVDIGTNGNLALLLGGQGTDQQLVDARFSGAGTVQKIGTGDLHVNGNVTATHFEITHGRLRGSGTLTVTETMHWTGGSIEMAGGTLVIAPGAVLTMDGASEKWLGSTLQNGGTVIWDGSGAFGGASGPQIHNLATGLIEARSDAPLTQWSGPATLNNEGVFRKTSSGDKTMQLHVINQGRFEALAGSLLIQNTRFNNHREVELNGGVTLTLAGGGTNSGAFTLQDTARLVFAAGGLHHLRQGATFSGPGMVELGGPSTEARLVVDGEVSIPHFTVALGRLSGAGRLSVTETMHWTGGSIEMAGGTLVIAPGAVLTMDGASEKWLGSTLQNGGTVIWDGSGAFGGASGPLIHNLATGLIEARSDAPLTQWSGPATLNNEGVFRKTSSGDKTMDLNVNNRGRFEALAGSLFIRDARFNNEAQVELGNGAVLTLVSGGTNRGSFVLGEATRLVFPATGSTYYFEQGTAITGPGRVEQTEGRLRVAGEIAMDNFVMRGGILEGPGALTITETMLWTGGYIALGGAGRERGLTIGPRARVTLDGAAEKRLEGELRNAGQIVWDGSGPLFGSGLVINNLPTGVIEARSDAVLVSNVVTITNAGVFRKVNGAGTKTLNTQFDNAGRLELLAGVLQVNGNFTNAPEGTVWFALGGPPGGGDYGALAVSGRAQLDGTLEVALTNGFRPALSNLFQVITANPRIGTFSTERGLLLGDGLKLTPLYAASSVSLLVTNAPADTPLILTLERAGEWLRLSWLPETTNATVLSTDDLASGAWSEFARPATNWLLIAPTNELRFFRVRQP